MFKKSLLVSSVSITSILVGLVVQSFLARYLSLEEYGTLQLLLSWIAIFSFFSLNSFNTVTTRAAAQDYPKLFVSASKYCFLFSLLGSISLIVVGWFFKRELLDLFLLAAIFFPFYSGINLGSAFYLGSSKFRSYAFWAITIQMLSLFFQVSAVVIFKDAKAVLFALLLASSLVNLFLTFRIAKKIEQKFDPRKNKMFIGQGVNMTLIGVMASVASKIQYIILSSSGGLATLAIYSAAQIFPNHIKNVVKSFLNPFSVHLASSKLKESQKLARKSLLLLFVFGLSVTLVVWLLLPWAVALIFGEKYQGSIEYAKYLSLVIILLPVNAILGSLIVFHGFQKAYAKITISVNVLKIVLFFLLVPKFEIVGIVLAVLLVDVATFFINITWFSRLPRNKEKSSVLVMIDSDDKGDGQQERIEVDSHITGSNIAKIIKADFIYYSNNYPWWVWLFAKISGTKKL